MVSWAHRTSRFESLINTVEAERYLRKPLLLDLLDELMEVPHLRHAAEVAGDILARVDDLDDVRLHRDLDVLRATVIAAALGASTLEPHLRAS